MNLGERIQQLRKARGMSQEQLAEQLTVSRQAVSKWELGESLPDIDNILHISRVFGVSTDYLLDNISEAPETKTETVQHEPQRRSGVRTLSYIMMSVGVLGILVMWILSSVVPAWKMVPDGLGAPVLVEGQFMPDEQRQQLDDLADMQFYTSVEVRGDLPAFLETYYLTGLFILCCALTVSGVVLLFLDRRHSTLNP